MAETPLNSGHKYFTHVVIIEEILDFTVWCGTILVLSGEHIVALMIGEMVLYNSNECCTMFLYAKSLYGNIC